MNTRYQGISIGLVVFLLLGVTEASAKPPNKPLQHISYANHSIFKVLLKLDTVPNNFSVCSLKPTCIVSTPINPLSAAELAIAQGSEPKTTYNIYMFHNFLNMNPPPAPTQCNSMVLSPGYSYNVVITDSADGTKPECKVV